MMLVHYAWNMNMRWIISDLFECVGFKLSLAFELIPCKLDTDILHSTSRPQIFNLKNI